MEILYFCDEIIYQINANRTNLEIFCKIYLGICNKKSLKKVVFKLSLVSIFINKNYKSFYF